MEEILHNSKVQSKQWGDKRMAVFVPIILLKVQIFSLNVNHFKQKLKAEQTNTWK